MQKSPPAKIETVITFLEMLDPPERPSAIVPPGKVAIVRAENPTVSFYRYLYNTVGEKWLWWLRRSYDDQNLAEIITSEDVHIYVLYVSGVPAGFAELDLTKLEQDSQIELQYYGLIPEFIGKGYGKYLLDWAVDTAWSFKPTRLTVHTCTLDHPSALGIYQKAGFAPYGQETEIIDDPRDIGLIPRRIHDIDTPESVKNDKFDRENEVSDTLVVDFPERTR